MLRYKRNNNAQAHFGEYFIVLTLVVGMAAGMTIFVKRTFQARMRDAKHTMVQIVREGTRDVYNGVLYLEYEPYYFNSVGTTDLDYNRRETLSAGASSGDSNKIFDETTTRANDSETAPPRDGDSAITRQPNP